MVRLSCVVQCTRTVLFALNIIFLLFGCSILGMGISVKLNGNFSAIIATENITQALDKETMQWIGTIIIISGGLTVCLTVFGGLGALCHSRAFLYVYSTTLSLIILLEFVAVIIVLRFRNDLWKSYDSSFVDVFQRAYHTNQTRTIRIMEQLEQDFNCCGVDSFKDYVKSNRKIPSSCYSNQILQGSPFKQGCAEAIVIWLWNELPMIATVLGSVLFIEIFGVITSLVVGVAISHSSNTDVYFKF